MAATYKRTAANVGGAGVIAATIAFLPAWEGMDKVARRDPVGTGHPVTYCYGQTSEFGDVKVGTTFTKAQCDAKLAESLPPYLAKIDKCITADMPDKTKASLLDAAWNAGPAAVCRSPMVKKMNAGDLEAGCDAFDGWYVRGDGNVLPGLIDRRAGELHGDHRKSERALCLEGLREASVIKEPPAPPPAPAPACKCEAPKSSPSSTPVVVPPPKRVASQHAVVRRCISIWDVVHAKFKRGYCQ